MTKSQVVKAIQTLNNAYRSLVEASPIAGIGPLRTINRYEEPLSFDLTVTRLRLLAARNGLQKLQNLQNLLP